MVFPRVYPAKLHRRWHGLDLISLDVATEYSRSLPSSSYTILYRLLCEWRPLDGKRTCTPTSRPWDTHPPDYLPGSFQYELVVPGVEDVVLDQTLSFDRSKHHLLDLSVAVQT